MEVMRKAIAAGVVVALGSCFAVNALAADKTWVGGTTGAWTDANSWSPVGTPALLNGDGNAISDNILIDSGSVMRNRALDSVGQWFKLTGSGSLTVSGGDFYIGGTDGHHTSNNVFTVDTTGQLTDNGRFTVAEDDTTTAQLIINNGTVNISGASAVVAGNGHGSVNQNGGTVNVNLSDATGSFTLGNNLGSAGTYNLSGGLLSIAQTLTIGLNGTGVFNMTGGELDINDSIGIINALGNGTFNFSGGKIVLAGDHTDLLGQNWFNTADGVTPTVSFANDVTTISAVPEPTTLALLGLGGLVLASRRRRRTAQ